MYGKLPADKKLLEEKAKLLRSYGFNEKALKEILGNIDDAERRGDGYICDYAFMQLATKESIEDWLEPITSIPKDHRWNKTSLSDYLNAQKFLVFLTTD
jgi:hypothetical protein